MENTNTKKKIKMDHITDQIADHEENIRRQQLRQNEMKKPWFQLSPPDHASAVDKWWMSSMIVDTENPKSLDDIQCYYIIQDYTTSGDIFWTVCTWLKNSNNRYSRIVYESQWDFNKKLEEMDCDDILYSVFTPIPPLPLYCHKNNKMKYKILERMNVLERMMMTKN